MKKLNKLLFGCILMVMFCYNVFAEMFMIDDVVDSFSESATISALNELGGSISAGVDKDNNKVNLLSGDMVMASFDYTDEYIEYDNREAVVAEDNYSEDFPQMLFFEGILETLFNFCGYNDKTIETFENITYEEYGLYIETEDYEFSGTDEDGGNWSAKGKYLKYFKVSLNSELISKLAEDYGVDMNVEEQESLFKDATPIVRIGDEITTSSVWLSAYIEGYDDEKELETPLCSFYRSTSIDGEYELVSEWQTPCLEGTSIQDEGLKAGTTYYYKAKVVGGTNYSEPVSVTTLSSDKDTNNGNIVIDSSTNNNTEGSVTNPKTGSAFVYLVVVLLMVSVFSFIMMYRYLKKQNI